MNYHQLQAMLPELRTALNLTKLLQKFTEAYRNNRTADEIIARLFYRLIEDSIKLYCYDADVASIVLTAGTDLLKLRVSKIKCLVFDDKVYPLIDQCAERIQLSSRDMITILRNLRRSDTYYCPHEGAFQFVEEIALDANPTMIMFYINYFLDCDTCRLDNYERTVSGIIHLLFHRREDRMISRLDLEAIICLIYNSRFDPPTLLNYFCCAHNVKHTMEMTEIIYELMIRRRCNKRKKLSDLFSHLARWYLHHHRLEPVSSGDQRIFRRLLKSGCIPDDECVLNILFSSTHISKQAKSAKVSALINTILEYRTDVLYDIARYSLITERFVTFIFTNKIPVRTALYIFSKAEMREHLFDEIDTYYSIVDQVKCYSLHPKLNAYLDAMFADLRAVGETTETPADQCCHIALLHYICSYMKIMEGKEHISALYSSLEFYEIINEWLEHNRTKQTL